MYSLEFEHYLSKFQLFAFITLVTSPCPQVIVLAAFQNMLLPIMQTNGIPVLCVIMQLMVCVKDSVGT